MTDTGDEVVLLLGGRSEIGLELVERLAAAGARRVVLAARRADDLADEQARVRAAGAADVSTVEFDADDIASHAALLDAVPGPIGTALLCFGVLGDQARAEADPAHAAAVVHTDYLAQVALLTELASRMRARGSGRLVVFSSVAGVRVRRANYVYGSAKAGLDGFASGLADALHGSGVHLLLVRPGFRRRADDRGHGGRAVLLDARAGGRRRGAGARPRSWRGVGARRAAARVRRHAGAAARGVAAHAPVTGERW